MKIKTLKIDGYKNLIDTELKHNSDLITIIGNNGSGKSNLLEALSIIFRNLYTLQQNINFSFLLEYQNTQGKTIRIEKKDKKINTNIQFLVDGESVINIREFLPKKVIAIYSGDEDRLLRTCYQPFFDEYISSINRSRVQGTQLAASLPPMLYINKQIWDLSLLCLTLSDLQDNKDFINEILKIPNIRSVEFVFNKSTKNSYNDNLVLDFIQKIEAKKNYTLEELKRIIESEYYAIDDIFKYLFIALRTGLLQNITVILTNNMIIENLSEGEKKLLLVKAALEFAEQEDSFFLLDEPDAHIHVNNKDKIIKAFEPYKQNRQIIITTHSPTITQCVDEDNLFMMTDGKFIPRNQQEIINDITGEFWSSHQQNNFLSSKKDIILLVEGKHDKEHILNAYQNMKNDYPTLKFDIFSMGGESKIQPFMQGLYEAGVFANKIYIAIYDNDKAGCKSYNNGFDKEINNCGYKKLHKDKLEHNNFFAFLLPKPNNYTQDCTIENMFDAEKYKEAYQQAVQQSLNYFNNKSIDVIIEDIKDKSKNILANNSKNYFKEDFLNFKPLFDLILNIKATWLPNINISSETPALNPNEETEIKEEDKPEYTEELHLEGKSKAITDLYFEYKHAILELDKDINTEAKQNYMAFKYFNKNIVDICIQKKQLKFWLNLHYGELIDKENVARNVSKIGHWGNGDYEIIISDNKNIDYILSLIKTVLDTKQTEYILS